MPYVFSDISRAIRGERRARGVSQAALAAKLGLRQGTISRAEQGADIHLNTLMQIARALDLELLLVPRRLVPAVQAVVGVPMGAGVEDVSLDFTIDEENES